MKTDSNLISAPDEELVVKALGGVREAYGALVSRHQSAACAVAYGVCGDFQASEDAAQEAFVTAWSQLGELADRTRFRPWVCGIARNVARTRIRRLARRGDHPEDGVPGELADAADTPDQAAITGEESALVWRAVDALEEAYREPLILFYREQQSAAAVASALEISEDAVRQRLVRGRTLLREELARRVESAFVRTRPGMVFTAGVMSSLPPLLATGALALSAGSAKAATGVAGSTQVASAGGIAAVSSLAGIVASALMGGAGFLVLFRFLSSPHVPKAVRSASRFCVGVAVGTSVVFTAWVWIMAENGWRLTSGWGLSPQAALFATMVLFLGVNLICPAIMARRLGRLRESLAPEVCWPHAPEGSRYISRARFLGLPLLSICLGSREGRGIAKGWIAIGEEAYGFFACGSVAMGVVSVGGISVGVLSIGGIALGGLAFGCASIGAIACGAVAMGWYFAAGCVVLAHGVATGLIAIAGHAAFGGSAYAELANNGAEWTRLVNETPLGVVIRCLPYAGWLSLLGLPGIYLAVRQIRDKKL
jgi:RNA polymerase sigma factor (sigma-70 family)